MPDFTSLGISDIFMNKLKEVGIIQPTPIQERALPAVMAGKDLIGQAQTGTGKTLGFVLPILEKIDPTASTIQALIVTPTRELALQITEEVKKLIADHDEIEVLAVYGGQDVEKQLKKLNRNIQIVVGTPGRLLDHIGRGTIDLSEVSFLVLDEADQMLHIGFLDEVEKIIRETPNNRQTMLFSATMPPEIRKLANKHMRDPEYVQVEKTQGPAENVKQIAFHTIDRAKQATLIQLVETHRPFLAVIFCRTKRRVSKLYDALKANGFSCDELHGDLSQAKRERVMKRFRDAEIQLLIATDVAARGLDVEGVTHVFNYDIPLDAESYVHRIGRTGRAGMKGIAITLYTSNDRPLLDEIEDTLQIRIDKKNIGHLQGENSDEKEQEENARNPRQEHKKPNVRAGNQRPRRSGTLDRSINRSERNQSQQDHSKSKKRGQQRQERDEKVEPGSKKRYGESNYRGTKGKRDENAHSRRKEGTNDKDATSAGGNRKRSSAESSDRSGDSARKKGSIRTEKPRKMNAGRPRKGRK
nr:DEAD/DEAH box helicase [Mesobacillus maritimus]